VGRASAARTSSSANRRGDHGGGGVRARDLVGGGVGRPSSGDRRGGDVSRGTGGAAEPMAGRGKLTDLADASAGGRTSACAQHQPTVSAATTRIAAIESTMPARREPWREARFLRRCGARKEKIRTKTCPRSS
jgi:hypothetical protein